MSKQSRSRDLRKAQREGKSVVCSMAPYEDWEMVYDPRRPHDPQPWRTRVPTVFRYSGGECHVKD